MLFGGIRGIALFSGSFFLGFIPGCGLWKFRGEIPRGKKNNTPHLWLNWSRWTFAYLGHHLLIKSTQFQHAVPVLPYSQPNRHGGSYRPGWGHCFLAHEALGVSREALEQQQEPLEDQKEIFFSFHGKSMPHCSFLKEAQLIAGQTIFFQKQFMEN